MVCKQDDLYIYYIDKVLLVELRSHEVGRHLNNLSFLRTEPRIFLKYSIGEWRRRLRCVPSIQ
jgi:hypothetical protein